jgi:predicted secreted protein
MHFVMDLKRSTSSLADREIFALRGGKLPYRIRVRRMSENLGDVWSLRRACPGDIISKVNGRTNREAHILLLDERRDERRWYSGGFMMFEVS